MIVINNDSGQLCNKLVLFAHVYATAIDTNQNVYHLYWIYSENLFSKSTQSGLRYFPGRLGKFFHYYDRYVLNKRIEKYSYKELRRMQDRKKSKIKSSSNHGLYVVDDWYYRDYEALFRHREKIVSAFRPTKETEETVKCFWEGVECQSNAITIGVHMRRGDYKEWCDGAYFYSDEDYRNWMEALSGDTQRRLCFVLCSNEEILLPHFESKSYSVCKAPGTQMEDLYTLSGCDYIMGPPSTYSWWAAFYGNRKYLTLYSAKQVAALDAFHYVKGEEFNPAHQFETIQDGGQ